MDKKVFSYTKDRLIAEGKIPVKCLGDSGEVFYELALEMVNQIDENNKKGEKTVFICPVGPVGQYPIFVRLVNERKLSLKNCYFINMDEYLDDDKNISQRIVLFHLEALWIELFITKSQRN